MDNVIQQRKEHTQTRAHTEYTFPVWKPKIIKTLIPGIILNNKFTIEGCYDLHYILPYK